jgi:hypothetical protein
MSTELELVKQLEESLDLGNLKEYARDVDNVMLLIDTSSSMNAHLRDEQHNSLPTRRIDALREVVNLIRVQGDVPMIAFGGPIDASVRFVSDVPEPAGGTPLAQAIMLAKEYAATRIVVISDGAPDSAPAALEAARAFAGRIDVSYVGNPNDVGEKFLEQLAQASGGSAFTGDLRDPKQLSRGVVGLLAGEVETPIQGEGFTTVDVDPEATEDDEDDDADDDDEDEDDDE